MTNAATLRDIDLIYYKRWGVEETPGTEAKLMTSKNKYAHFSVRMSIDTDFNLMKVDSFNNVFSAWVTSVSQQTKQDGYLEDSYQTRFADEVLCPNSTKNKIEERYKEKQSQSSPSFNHRG